jgi:hypothetical protein
MGQSPRIFFRKRVVPSTPPSFVKLYFIASLVSIGLFSSTPINDHVPELKKAQSFPSAGTDTTAEAVS